jgi:hypothetical protein
MLDHKDEWVIRVNRGDWWFLHRLGFTAEHGASHGHGLHTLFVEIERGAVHDRIQRDLLADHAEISLQRKGRPHPEPAERRSQLQRGRFQAESRQPKSHLLFR